MNDEIIETKFKIAVIKMLVAIADDRYDANAIQRGRNLLIVLENKERELANAPTTNCSS